MSTAEGGCEQGGQSPAGFTLHRHPQQPAQPPAHARLRIPLAPQPCTPLHLAVHRATHPSCIPPGSPACAPCHAKLAPPLLPLSLSPWRWPGDSTERSCADERQARGLQVTILGSEAGGQGWQRAPRRVCTLLPSAAPAPGGTEGAAVPRAVPCQRSPHTPLCRGPAASWPATIFIRISEKCPAVPRPGYI